MYIWQVDEEKVPELTLGDLTTPSENLQVVKEEPVQ